PLLPNGKIDRRALPAPAAVSRPGSEASYVAPRTRAEAILCEVWASVLGVKQIGVFDNFFELGGDSILAIQIVARATQAGLRLAPGQIFQHQIVAELASVADLAGAAAIADGELVTGPVSLTPIQRWFFEQDFVEPHHFNQAIV